VADPSLWEIIFVKLEKAHPSICRGEVVDFKAETLESAVDD
jgi:hypothetical protein